MQSKRLSGVFGTQLSLQSNSHIGRKWQTTPILLPGEFHRQRRLAGYSPWGHKKSDMTATNTYTHTHIYTHTEAVVWRRKWQPIPILLPGESHGQRSLGGLKSMGSQIDTTE